MINKFNFKNNWSIQEVWVIFVSVRFFKLMPDSDKISIARHVCFLLTFYICYMIDKTFKVKIIHFTTK